MIPILYGIQQCDTVRKARRWLDEHGVAYRFHDFRGDGLTDEQLRTWAAELGCDALLNRRSTTWRQLPESQRSELDEARTLELLRAHPTLIKRPLLDIGTQRIVGFDPDRYTRLLLG